jgi:hypothetical protein
VDELASSAVSGRGRSLSAGSAGATTETIVRVAGEAATINADAFVVEEAGVADRLTSAVVSFLAVGALGGRDAPLSVGVNAEAGETLCATVDVSGALSAVGVARHTASAEGGESRGAAGDALSVADDPGVAAADAVDGGSAGGTSGLAEALEEVETAEAGRACPGAVAGGAGVGAAGADAAAGVDAGVGAGEAVAVGRAGAAFAVTVDALLLVGIEELLSEATLLTDRAGADVAGSALEAVLRSVLAAVATRRAGNANALEGELIFAALHSAGSVGGDGALEAGSTVVGTAVAGGALDGARHALGFRGLVEAIGAVVNAGTSRPGDLVVGEEDGGTGSPAAALVEHLVGGAGDAVGGRSEAGRALEVADLANTSLGEGTVIAGLNAALLDC